MPLKTLFLNPPSFENFDGGAGSRWPATREIESYWYPVWLAYPAGMLEGSRLLDAPPHHVSAEETIRIAKEYEFLVLFTSTPGFPGDIKLSAAIKAANPNIKIAFVGPHVSVLPEKSLQEATQVDFMVRKEFDYAVTDFAKGKPLEEIAARQWQLANQQILDDLADLPSSDWCSLRYEDLLNDPRGQIQRLCTFAEIPFGPRMEEVTSKTLPNSRYTLTAPDTDKWRKNEAEIERVLPKVAALAEQLNKLTA